MGSIPFDLLFLDSPQMGSIPFEETQWFSNRRYRQQIGSVGSCPPSNHPNLKHHTRGFMRRIFRADGYQQTDLQIDGADRIVIRAACYLRPIHVARTPGRIVSGRPLSGGRFALKNKYRLGSDPPISRVFVAWAYQVMQRLTGKA